jgi:hypothetical protein
MTQRAVRHAAIDTVKVPQLSAATAPISTTQRCPALLPFNDRCTPSHGTFTLHSETKRLINTAELSKTNLNKLPHTLS